MAEKTPQRFDLEVDGTTHHVEVVVGAFRRTVRWFVDGELVATKTSSEDSLRVPSGTDLGDLGVRFSGLGKPRRATWYPDGAGPKELIGVGGIDLDPEPGSPAARFEDRVRAHPRLYALQQGGGGVLRIAVPLLIAAVVARFAVKLPWPDVSIPTPDLDLPSIPLPDWHAPDWLTSTANALSYAWPLLIAIAIATAEIRRRRTQDRLREERRSGQSGA
ncbi:hypothetical protein [Aeromicrobium terrae]|uniref:Uncharacterized protein n=1 Tax=Aeromicrobium terrae TaxID=2498846 RepID=A0A5C8NNM5_9ACTN|nr:hypothetical protein [Aeromicrobium terrae]TXL62073.1 hypothetical protein FHP06_05015 [Aeromicrobium terrae]